jgi:hypothetical protein
VSSREPNSFIDKEAIAANNYGSRDHRMEKYGPDGAQHGGWEWKNSRGEPSPLGHHLAEVCIPLIVDVDALHKAEMTTPEDIAIGRQVYMFVPPDREGRICRRHAGGAAARSDRERHTLCPQTAQRGGRAVGLQDDRSRCAQILQWFQSATHGSLLHRRKLCSHVQGPRGMRCSVHGCVSICTT